MAMALTPLGRASARKSKGKLSPLGVNGVSRVKVDMPHSKKLTKLVDLKYNQCRFPVGDPATPDFGFCGAQQTLNSPYCPYHTRISYVNPDFVTNRKKAKDQ